MKELAKTNIIQHTIYLLNSTLIIQKCYFINQQNKNWFKKKSDELLEKSIIKELISFQTIPIIIISKKDGS